MRWFVLALCYITMIDRAAAGDVQDAAEALRRGQYPKAIKLLDAVLADEPNQARARAMRGRAHLEAKAYDKAAADFTAAIEAKSAAPQGEAYLGRGRAWYGLGKCDEALVDLNKAVELKPRSAACYFHRGRVLQTKRDFDAACYAKAVHLRALSTDTFQVRVTACLPRDPHRGRKHPHRHQEQGGKAVGDSSADGRHSGGLTW